MLSAVCVIITLHVLTWTKEKKEGAEEGVEVLGCSCWVLLVRMSKVFVFGTGQPSPQQPDFKVMVLFLFSSTGGKLCFCSISGEQG